MDWIGLDWIGSEALPASLFIFPEMEAP